MSLPSSGLITLAQIQQEFGGSNPISLNEYYGVNTGVPGSGTISMNDFHGTSASSHQLLIAKVNPAGQADRYGFITVDDNGSIISPLGNITPRTYDSFGTPDEILEFSLAYYNSTTSAAWWIVSYGYSGQTQPVPSMFSIEFLGYSMEGYLEDDGWTGHSQFYNNTANLPLSAYNDIKANVGNTISVNFRKLY